MSIKESPKKSARHYPPVYEKIIPVALTTIGVVIFVLLLVTVGVALKVIPGV